jgi:hypothetical protein
MRDRGRNGNATLTAMDGAMVTQWRRQWKVQRSDGNGSDGQHNFDGSDGWHDFDGDGQRDGATVMDGNTAMDMKNKTIN